ncbi:flavin reductase family protein [Sulfoacidibacillus thermotolerans]|uniref:flavin reductase family protein n=1 Tax=Sulfoacidibacillus thermotolerans TaxID=1765684 RepID=UPI001FEB68CD|nr:flavin reductase family protein [Sulfoacidibacillus thermotolerans]
MTTALDSTTLRRVLGLFATGVTVIVAGSAERAHAMTANSFTSVSLDPPLILICVQHANKMAGLLETGSHFTVNFLAQDQEQISRYFSGNKKMGDTPDFELIPWCEGSRLAECLCSLSCQVEHVFSAGDHVIFLSRVQSIYEKVSEQAPLLFWKGRYQQLAMRE